MFCLNRAPTRGKLDARSREGIFIGYAEQSKGYRIWLPNSKRVEITRDVKFLENSLKAPRMPCEDFCSEDTSLNRSVDQNKTKNINVELFSEPLDMGQEDLEETVEKPGEADERVEEIAPTRKRGRSGKAIEREEEIEPTGKRKRPGEADEREEEIVPA